MDRKTRLQKPAAAGLAQGLPPALVATALRVSLWVGYVAAAPRIPGGAAVRAIETLLSLGRDCFKGGRWLQHTGARLAEKLPDPAPLMAALATAGVLLFPEGRVGEVIPPPSLRAASRTPAVPPELAARGPHLTARPASPAGHAAVIARAEPKHQVAACQLLTRKDGGTNGGPVCAAQQAADDAGAAPAKAAKAVPWWQPGTALPAVLAEQKRFERLDPAARFDAFVASEPLLASSPPEPKGTPHPTSEIGGSPGIRQLRYRIERGQTVSDILAAAGVSPPEIARWLEAADRVYDLNHVLAGQTIVLDLDTQQHALRRLALDIDANTRLVAEHRNAGFEVRRDEIAFERRLRLAAGRIDHSLYTAAIAQGVPDRIISEVAEILGWELDFSRDLRPGDRFRILYEELVDPAGTESRTGRVLAAEVTTRGRRYEAFYYRRPGEIAGGYYDPSGRALGRAFLRYPVAYSRISSRFSAARLHPVLKRRRPHYGVDFAAPPGTPVHAIAAGTVTVAGWRGASGRLVKIRHDNVYESAYAHLSRFADGIRPGARVAKGQVIGYVGSTGLATGPHLHLALYKNGKYVDPLRTALPQAPALEGPTLAQFQRTVAAVHSLYAAEQNTAPTKLALVAAAFSVP
ncbi:MAG: hypothetical protein D6815_07915 [Candidatus Dadabacteria bacterium]|nr:MAG: hypothetical protein D6815_07915 [Candidatus Dadabacteria bacterium]